MKKCSAIFVRLLCLLLCLSLLAAPIPVFAAIQEGSGEIVEVSEVIYIDQVENCADFYGLDANGNVDLKPGNHERWIDRLDLSDAQYALDFYAWLERSISGALMDPSQGETLKGSYVYPVKTNTGSIPFTYDANAADSYAAAAAAAEDMVNYGLPEYLNDVKPYIVAVYSAFDRDHPEVFWLTGGSLSGSSVSYSFSYGGGKGTVNYTQKFYFFLTYRENNFDIRQENCRTVASISAMTTSRDAAVDRILSQITATDTYGRIRQLNKILTTQNCYNSDVFNAPYTAYQCTSALLGSTGTTGPVCEGYSRAFKVLCDELEIPCVLVDGMSYNNSGSGPHMWNNVRMPDGNWYAVDVTWNDPAISGITSEVSGYEREDYLLVGGETIVGGQSFSKSHVVENSAVSGSTCFTNGPVLSQTAYTYRPESEKFPINLAQVELGNALNMYFLFPVDAYTDWNGCYAVLTKTYADGRESTSVTVAAADWENKTSSGKQYKRIGFHNISAKEMADSITIEVFNANGDAISTQGSDTIAGYLERMLAKNSSTKFRRLAVDMLNYGAAAQLQFHYNTENLSNAGIDDYQQYGTTADAACANNQVKGDHVRGLSVSLENNIVMNVYFEGQTADMTAIATFKNHAGEDVTVELTSVKASNGYCFQVNALAVADMRALVTITCKTADGTVYGTLTDSVEGYVARTGLAKSINQAIIKFSDSAKAYLH